MLSTEAHQLAWRLQCRHVAIQIQSVQTADGQSDLIVHNGLEAGGDHEGSSRKGGVYILIVPPQLFRRVGPQGPALGHSRYIKLP